MRLPGFIGPTYTDESPAVDAQESINWYLRRNGPTSKTPWSDMPTPGLRLFASFPIGPVRALFYQNSRCFAIAGTKLYEVFTDGTVTLRGTVDSNDSPATITGNGATGAQLFIVSGGKGYIFNLNTDVLTEIADVDFPDNALMGAFLDQYFIVLQADTGRFFISSVTDGTGWDPMDVGRVSQQADTTRALIVDHREIWLPGEQTTGVWYNSGNPDFPFEPINGVFIEQGIAAPWSAARFDNSLVWLGGDERGAGIVYRAQGFTPARISTHPIEHYLRRYREVLSDALAWVYQENGHIFYLLYVPGADATLVYDAATQQWHKRAHWDPATLTWTPHVGRCHAYAFSKHLVGDRRTGAIYEMSLDYFDEELVVVS